MFDNREPYPRSHCIEIYLSEREVKAMLMREFDDDLKPCDHEFYIRKLIRDDLESRGLIHD